jgi:hypothetical protein
MFGSWSGFFAAVKATLFNRYQDQGARDLLTSPALGHSSQPLVQISGETKQQMEETRV